MYDPGLHIIYGGPESGLREDAAEVDIVAVHGLNFKNNPNHARATWTSQGSIWIRDFLPPRLRRPCRVMLFAYNSSPAMGAAAMRLDDHARTLLRCLMDQRKDAPNRPILFICHSLGGIVVKSALVEATLDPAYRPIVRCTSLLVFFATPHLGGNYGAIGDVAAKIVRTGLRTPSNDLLDGLKAGSRDVIRRFEQARHLPEGCLVISYYETESYGRLGLIVEKRSAVLDLPDLREQQVPLKANHSRVCKFPTADSCRPVTDLIVTELDRALEQQKALEPGPENVHWLVPRSGSPFFTGREDIVERITKAIQPDTNPSQIQQKRFVLTGLGGQGKSEVCLNVVDRLRSQFWAVFWVDVGTKSTAVKGFTRISRLLGSETTEIDDALLLLSSCPTEHNWLLILDNADDVDVDYQKYIPSGTRGTVLMTSRLPDCSVYNTVGYENLENLTKEDCVRLLFKIMAIPEDSQSEAVSAAELIAEEMGFHTLALIQAGAYVSAGHCSMASYPTEYREHQERILKYGLSQSQSRYRNVYATFEMSISLLESSHREFARNAVELLELLSTIHYNDIPVGIFEDAWHGAKLAKCNPEDDRMNNRLSSWHVSQLPKFFGADKSDWSGRHFSVILEELVSLAIVKKTQLEDETVVSLHPLIHSWLATRQSEIQKKSAEQSSACLLALVQYSRDRWRPHHRRLGPHLIRLTGSTSLAIGKNTSRQMLQTNLQIFKFMQALRCDHDLAQLLEKTLLYFNLTMETPTTDLLPLFYVLSLNLFNRGKIQQSINTIEKVRELQLLSLDDHHLDRIATDQELARAYHVNGQWKEAIDILEKIRDIHERHFKLRKDHPERLVVLHQLGQAYETNGQAKEAIELLKEVVSIQESTLEIGDPGSISSKCELANAYIYNAQVKEAIELLEEVDKSQAKYLSDNHPNRLGLQTGLAKAYLEDGQLRAAILLFEDICDKQNAILKEDNPGRLAVEHLLGSAYRMNGQTEAAICIFQKILRLSNDRESHPHRIAVEYELGAAYRASGQTKAAINILERLEGSSENPIEKNHPSRLLMRVELSLAYMASGDTEKAIHVLQNVIEAQRLTLDEAHPNLIASKNKLGSAYLDLGKHKEAVEIFEALVQIQSESPEQYSKQLVSQHGLARAYLANGQLKGAIHIFERLVETEKHIFDRDHPKRLNSQHELARAYIMNGQVKQGIRLCEEVADIQASTIEKKHPNHRHTQRLLSSAYLDDNQIVRAIGILKEIDELEQEMLDEAHPDRLATQHQLGSAYIKAGQTEKAIIILEEAHSVVQTTFRENYPTRLALEHLLASAYLGNGQTKDAIERLQEIMRVYDNSGSERSHPGRLAAMHQLGSAHMKLNQTDRAIAILEEVVNIQSGSGVDEGNPYRLSSQHELGCCYLSVGRTDEAISIFKEVVRVEARTRDRDDPSRVASQETLGSAYLRKGMAAEAVMALEEVVSIRKTRLEKSHLLRLASEHELGLAYLENGDDKKGISLLEEILIVEKHYLQQNNSLRLKTQYELGCAYLDAGRTKESIPLLEDVAYAKTGQDKDNYPTSKEVQEELAKAYKANEVMSRLMAAVGLDACFGRR